MCGRTFLRLAAQSIALKSVRQKIQLRGINDTGIKPDCSLAQFDRFLFLFAANKVITLSFHIKFPTYIAVLCTYTG